MRDLSLRTIGLNQKPGCACADYTLPENTLRTDIHAGMKLADALDVMQAAAGKQLTLISEHTFATNVQCPVCGVSHRLYAPLRLVYEDKRFCPACRKAGHDQWVLPNPDVETVTEFSLQSEDELLAMSLFDLGFPKGALLFAIDSAGEEYYFRCMGDRFGFPSGDEKEEERHVTA